MLFCAKIFAQTEATQKEKGSVQLDFGMFGDFLYTSISGPQMERLTGEDLPPWAPTAVPKISEGHSSSLNAGYYTVTFQKPIKPNKQLWWSAGVSILPARNITECFYYTDSITSQIISLPSSDSIQIFTMNSWLGTSGIRGFQINFPVGLRLVEVERSKRWIQVGLNLSPGFTFNHDYLESTTVVTSTAVADPGGPDRSKFREIEINPEYSRLETKKIKGSYFTAYAGLPVNCCFGPSRPWQFMLSLEPGYTMTALGNETVKGAVMLRLGLGVKYVFKTS